MKRLTVSLLTGVLSAASLNAANIAWVSFHPGDASPSANAATAGFTMAPDIGYTDLLAAHGHTVTRVVTSATPDAATLNSFDLVIIGRSVPSANYQNAGATAWNSITAPAIVMGGYVMRNSRMGYTTGGTIPDTTADISLTASDRNHPIFAGVPLDESGTMINSFAGIVSFNSITQRGVSVNTDPVAGGGTVLASISAAGSPAGGLIIGEWPAGATMGNATADILGGRRLVFLSGSRENSITSEGSGIYDLSGDGARMFANAVNYMAVPEPSTISLGLLGLLAGAALRRRR